MHIKEILTLRVTVTMGEIVHLLLGLAQNPGGEGGGAWLDHAPVSVN